MILMAVLTPWVAGAADAPKPVEVKTARPTRGDVLRSVTLPGSIRANQQATLHAKVPGYLKSIAVDKGDKVQAGQALGEIEVPELLADLAKYKAELHVAEMDSRRLSAAREKAPDLVTPQSLDDAAGKFEIAKANIERIEIMLRYSRLTAPFSGVVTMRYVDAGAFIPAATGANAASAAVLTLMDFQTVRAQVAVPEIEAALVREGQPVKVSVEGLPEKVFEGKVTRQAYALDDASRTMLVESDLPNCYKRHDENIQDVAGNIFEATKQSYTVGAALTAQLDLGDAIYKSLASRQLVIAAEESAEVRRQETLYGAATGYFELARAQGAAQAAREGVRIAEDYGRQVQRAVDAGIAFQGDVYRARVQVEKNRILVRQAQEQGRIAAARLSQTLRLPPTTQLVPQEAELAPLSLMETNATLDSLVARALGTRPELKQSGALKTAAAQARKGARYGPWVPTLGAQYFEGGLGGGPDGQAGNFDHTSDLVLGLSWKIGPGGLFDRSRIRGAEARERASGLELEKARDEVVRQVVEAHARTQSLADQLVSAHRALHAAEQSLKYSRERKEFGVGAVLEVVQAEQELTRARLDYVGVLAEHNKAQFSAARAIGQLGETGPKTGAEQP